ncbi:uncharacterized protein SPAPADRAFT_61552 [Spathaspora passalidarum NRRL Y-27907]|uniref:Cytidyltransferase-like domain-containing protein n=1 Tax=Spathaspora passalidarum (strain NRRL Y-27907 / 11-Y1) TaxID=619300 RepID=G3ANA0_SPAPN|nr:uncharacterized protein SPAPADRAFT_61552 [Spathaspora passalidarum NRRL Y-27907]EGW32484.1 hypothetical protein SPAPADRAFT_61552 [Spathaspora passalidarum NRRL Y-27907]
MKSKFIKPLQEFIASKSDFSVLYHTSPEFITPATQRICVLDSSFNPPHLGHYALVEESLKNTFGSVGQSNDNKIVLLLLSIKNADKAAPKPESLEHRLQMMYLMANDISKKWNISVSIGVTKHAKFVDKSVSCLNFIKPSSTLKLTFLVGFDTLVRILNPKYYLPDKLSTSLEQFMKSTDLFCLTRVDKDITNDEQNNYLEEIRGGRHEDIPSHWGENIFLVKNFGDDIANISSSEIRLQISQGNDDWKSKVVPEIRDFIVNNDLYKST